MLARPASIGQHGGGGGGAFPAAGFIETQEDAGFNPDTLSQESLRRRVDETRDAYNRAVARGIFSPAILASLRYQYDQAVRNYSVRPPPTLVVSPPIWNEYQGAYVKRRVEETRAAYNRAVARGIFSPKILDALRVQYDEAVRMATQWSQGQQGPYAVVGQAAPKVIKPALGRIPHTPSSGPRTSDQIRAQIDMAVARGLSPKIVGALQYQYAQAVAAEAQAVAAEALSQAVPALSGPWQYPPGTKVLDVWERYRAREAPLYALPSESSDRVAVVPHYTPVVVLQTNGSWCQVRTGLDQPISVPQSLPPSPPGVGNFAPPAVGPTPYGQEPWWGGLFRVTGWVPCEWVREPKPIGPWLPRN